MEKSTRKTDSLAWELKLAPALRDSESLLSVSSVKVGAQGYTGLRCTDVTDCFDSFTTACLRIHSETGLLSLEVTKCCVFFSASLSQGRAQLNVQRGQQQANVVLAAALLSLYLHKDEQQGGTCGLGVSSSVS